MNPVKCFLKSSEITVVRDMVVVLSLKFGYPLERQVCESVGWIPMKLEKTARTVQIAA